MRPPKTQSPARVDARNRAGIELEQRDSSKTSARRKADRLIELLAERFPLCLAIDPALVAALSGSVLPSILTTLDGGRV